MSSDAHAHLAGATYSRARGLVPTHVPCVVLQLGAGASTWAWGSGPAPDETHALAIGIETLAQRYFRAASPTEAAVESAIEEVEDVVMPWHRVLPPQSALVACDAYVAELARWADMPAQNRMMLKTDLVEDMFNQWVDGALGGALNNFRLPISGTIPATLLVVREVLHHLSFDSILVQHSVPKARN